ncbi:MAG: hypothetical protein Q9221_006615 [Calogaya cf. arnoldii]
MEAREEPTDATMTDVAAFQVEGDETPPQRRKLVLMTPEMLWKKEIMAKRLQRLLSGSYTVIIQKLPEAYSDLPSTTFAYGYCPSLNHECLPGTYRVSLEPGCLSDNMHKWIPVETLAQLDYVIESSEQQKDSLLGKSAQNNVVWYCLRCFEKVYRCTDEDVAAMKALALPEYVPIARLASNIYLEGRGS